MHLCHKDRCPVGSQAYRQSSRAEGESLARGGRRDSRAVFFSRVCKMRCLLFGKSIHVTFFFVSNRHSNSPLYGIDTILFFMCVTQYSLV